MLKNLKEKSEKEILKSNYFAMITGERFKKHFYLNLNYESGNKVGRESSNSS